MKNTLFTTKFQVIGLILCSIIGLGLIYGIFLIPYSSNDPKLVINSVTLNYPPQNDSFLQHTPILQLNISLQFIVPNTLTISTTGFNLCTFGIKLQNTSEWSLNPVQYLLCIGPTSHTYDSGTYLFNLVQEIMPTSTNFTIGDLVSFNVVVFSRNYSNFTIQSDPFPVNYQISNISSNTTPNGNFSLTINSANLKNQTYPDNSTGYSLSADISFHSNIAFNLSYGGCSSPFNLRIVTPELWNLTHIDCMIFGTHFIPAGYSNYTLLYDLVNPDGITNSSQFSLPPNFSIQAYSSQLNLLSNVFILNLS